jgi:tRNA threonylcarbamoyladenosine modification (KEOPS) complex Cgi121 subunit
MKELTRNARQITDAMKIWGVRDDSRDFLVVLLDEPDSLSPEEFLASFRKIVDGEERPLEELGQCADVAEICSVGWLSN